MAKHKGTGKRPSKPQTPLRCQTLLIPGGLVLALVVGATTWFIFQNPTPVSSGAQYKGGPRLVVNPELIDFGPVQFERMVTGRFRLRNVGDQPLRLAVDPQVEAIEGC